MGSDVAQPADEVLVRIRWDSRPDLGQQGDRCLRLVQYCEQRREDAVGVERAFVLWVDQFTAQLCCRVT
ncbi:hypothetical protein A6A25_34245 [Saccharothrix sp. CB00851]|nr:hypothetical protein A6A25_34245 [Saccharothrix sp. CB00851]